MKITAAAPGKLILLGEYAVLKGAPALAAAVNCLARVTLKTVPSGDSYLSSSVLNIDKLPFTILPGKAIQYRTLPEEPLASRLKFFNETILLYRRLLQRAGKDFTPLDIVLDTSAFFQPNSNAKLGLGSSAALTVALLGALTKISGIELSANELFRFAREIHFNAQARLGSGIDIAAAVFGGISEFQTVPESREFAARIKRRILPPGLHILPIWSGRAASTPRLVQQVESLRERNARQYASLFSQLIKTARCGCEAFAAGRTDDFLAAVRTYQKLLIEQGRASGAEIFSPEHRQISQIVEKHGGVYKISGAGGGDFGLAFSNNPEIVQKLKTALQNSSFSIFDLDMNAAGIKFVFGQF